MQMYNQNSFITLTYDPKFLPYRGQLTHEHFQKFMKRLRKENTQLIRYYMGGEYGTSNEGEHRPHYHAILFNKDWTDRKYFKKSPSGEKIYTSSALERLWPYGYSSTANATFLSAAYIARYCMQKVTGERAAEHYKREDENGTYQLNPEYNMMSNGIGADWLKFYKQDVYTDDYVIVRGHKSRVPRYYDKKFAKLDEEQMQHFKELREWKAYQVRTDNTDERLTVKEKVTEAKIKALARGKI